MEQKTSPRIRPRILIDARMVGPIPHGIGRYVQDLLEGLNEKQSQGELPYEVVALTQKKTEIQGLDTINKISSSCEFLTPSEFIYLPAVVRRSRADLYHSPSFSSPLGLSIPSVVTLHDLNHLTFGSIHQKIYYRLAVRRFALRASQICTVSESSQKEIASWLRISESRIAVVPNAIQRPAPTLSPAENVTPIGLSKSKFFLCVANAKPHKNLEFLIRSYRMARESLEKRGKTPFSLAVTVGPLPGLEFPGVVYLGAVGDSVLESLYQRAAVLLSPSLYEGFGRTPVEALVRGLPVLMSRIASHEEIARDLPPGGVQLIHPMDLDGWVNAMLRAQTEAVLPVDSSVSEKLLDRYSRRELVKRMDQIYRRVLGLDA